MNQDKDREEAFLKVFEANVGIVIKIAIILLYLDGKTHEEIAHITGISKTNVATRIGRIKEQIKKIIQQKNG